MALTDGVLWVDRTATWSSLSPSLSGPLMGSFASRVIRVTCEDDEATWAEAPKLALISMCFSLVEWTGRPMLGGRFQNFQPNPVFLNES
jgi:hypothetical protein